MPGYLSAIPQDPRTANTRPLGYVLAGNGQRPLIYSAGSSMLSPEQIARSLPAAAATVPSNASAPAGTVIFFDASPWAPKPPSSPQGHNDQP